MIDFNIPPFIGDEMDYVSEAILQERKISGDGKFTKGCSELLKKKIGSANILLTTSCSHALDMSAILGNIKPGDEVIMPSFTFVSTANAFVLRGAKIVFVDIRPDTMNINENLIEAAITPKTRAIVPVHYAGVACEMDKIMDLAQKYNLLVIEDAAQALMSTYKGKPLGAFGDFACFSFHETKNYSMGEGGAIVVNNEKYMERAEIIREKGTDRSKFFRGQVDKYSWVDMGSSYLPSEINAAYLYPQLKQAENINNNRLLSWERYYSGLKNLEKEGYLQLPVIPDTCEHNAHMFYIKLENLKVRTQLIKFLKSNDIYSVFHYIPLHSSDAGRKFGVFYGEDQYTTSGSERLLRLPMYYGLTKEDIEFVIQKINEFFRK